MQKKPGNLKEFKLVLAYPTDPNTEIMGGMTRYFRFLLRQALKKGMKVKFVGVKLGNNLQYESAFSFIPIVRGTDKWWIYFVVSFFRVPFLKIERDEIIHSGRLIFLLPYILFHPYNPKVLTSDEPRLAANLAYPRPIYALLSAIYSLIEHFMLKRINAVISAEHVTKNYYKIRYSHLNHIFKERNYPAVHVNTNLFRPLDKVAVRKLLNIDINDKVMLFVGRISAVKGIDFLIDAFVEFTYIEPNSIFIIVGRGDDEKRLKSYAKKKAVGDWVLFLGEKRSEELVKIYNCADVLVMGSLTEGNSGVLREALACGVPVVSTDLGDAKIILKNPLLGRVVSKRSPKLFAEAIKAVLSEDTETVREACRIKSFEFSEEACFESVLKSYKELRESR